MNNTPDLMPILSKGAHDDPAEGACIMEYASFLAGEKWSDYPACTHRALASAAQVVNDRLPHEERQRLLPLLPRLMGTAPTGTDRERQVLSVRLAAWCARRVLHLVRDDAARAACGHAIETAEAWTRGEATEEECRTAAAYADAATDATAAADAAADAAYAAAYAAYTDAATDATAAADAATGWDLVEFLTDLLDYHDEITGRTEMPEVTAEDLARCAALTGAAR